MATFSHQMILNEITRHGVLISHALVSESRVFFFFPPSKQINEVLT